MWRRPGLAAVAACGACLASAVALGSAESAADLRLLLEEVVVTYVIDPVTGHKRLWPLDVADVLGVSAAVLGLIIAAGGGIGGGGMLVPIYVLVMGFQPKYAIPLSNFTVLGGAVTNVVMNYSKRHATADRSLVDWDLLLLMQPLTIAGALAGGFVNKLAPELLIVVLLVALLAVTSETTIRKGRSLYAKETAALRKAGELVALGDAAAKADADAEGEALLGGEAGAKPRLDEAEQVELDAILAEEREAAPAWKVGVLLGMCALIIAVNLAKGGGAFPSPLGIECGTGAFWAATLFMFASLVAIAFSVRAWLVARTAAKDRLGYVYAEGDFHWDARATLKYPGVCFFAGMCAGLFGIGGGIVNGPLMLQLGVPAGVAAATTATMILLTAVIAATTFLTFGLVQADYALRLFAVGVAATAVGQVGMSYVVQKSGRQSYVAFSIGAVVSISTVLMGFHGLVSLAYPDGGEPQPKGICLSGR
ncbi:hypothetical protein M885DRAFT_625964 [Pelagophyceae sp. CCMP2097]|nr:hypothetical protein M885DRAFT_625964 [Pelagophyceae sp. CCMP2097]|mmetsp:Transcript_6830/g.22114  ORF Transcript_6830/g.22114 Transcript_6830/m.22114 type:complete len:479 (-) Transcript_6830:38-1474(-)